MCACVCNWGCVLRKSNGLWKETVPYPAGVCFRGPLSPPWGQHEEQIGTMVSEVFDDPRGLPEAPLVVQFMQTGQFTANVGLGRTDHSMKIVLNCKIMHFTDCCKTQCFIELIVHLWKYFFTKTKTVTLKQYNNWWSSTPSHTIIQHPSKDIMARHRFDKLNINHMVRKLRVYSNVWSMYTDKHVFLGIFFPLGY